VNKFQVWIRYGVLCSTLTIAPLQVAQASSSQWRPADQLPSPVVAQQMRVPMPMSVPRGVNDRRFRPVPASAVQPMPAPPRSFGSPGFVRTPGYQRVAAPRPSPNFERQYAWRPAPQPWTQPRQQPPMPPMYAPPPMPPQMAMQWRPAPMPPQPMMPMPLPTPPQPAFATSEADDAMVQNTWRPQAPLERPSYSEPAGAGYGYPAQPMAQVQYPGMYQHAWYPPMAAAPMPYAPPMPYPPAPYPSAPWPTMMPPAYPAMPQPAYAAMPQPWGPYGGQPMAQVPFWGPPPMPAMPPPPPMPYASYFNPQPWVPPLPTDQQYMAGCPGCTF
jgi:hypothetical protein